MRETQELYQLDRAVCTVENIQRDYNKNTVLIYPSTGTEAAVQWLLRKKQESEEAGTWPHTAYELANHGYPSLCLPTKDLFQNAEGRAEQRAFAVKKIWRAIGAGYSIIFPKDLFAHDDDGDENASYYRAREQEIFQYFNALKDEEEPPVPEEFREAYEKGKADDKEKDSFYLSQEDYDALCTITVRVLNGKTFKVLFKPDDTLGMVRKKIADKLGIEPENVRILFGGINYEEQDDVKRSELDLPIDPTFHVFCRKHEENISDKGDTATPVRRNNIPSSLSVQSKAGTAKPVDWSALCDTFSAKSATSTYMPHDARFNAEASKNSAARLVKIKSEDESITYGEFEVFDNGTMIAHGDNCRSDYVINSMVDFINEHEGLEPVIFISGEFLNEMMIVNAITDIVDKGQLFELDPKLGIDLGRLIYHHLMDKTKEALRALCEAKQAEEPELTAQLLRMLPETGSSPSMKR